MGLPRPPKGFERVYSAPEPPRRSGRPGRLGRRALTGAGIAAGLVAAIAAALLLWPGSEPEPAPRAGPEPGTRAPASPSQPASPSPKGEGVPFAELPGGCAGLSDAEVGRVVGTVTNLRVGDRQDNVACNYTVRGGHRLTLDLQLYRAVGALDPVGRARAGLAAARELQLTPDRGDTKTLEHGTLRGHESYRAFVVAAGENPPATIAIVAVRVRNVQVTVSYSENAPRSGSALSNEKPGLDKARKMAEQAVAKMA